MKRFMAFVNRFFGTCFSSPSQHKTPEVSPLEVLLKPADHDPEMRDFGSAEHFRADRRHKASTSMEELELGCVDAYSDLLTSHEELLNITHAGQLFFRRIFAQSFSLNEFFVKERVSSLNVTSSLPAHPFFSSSLSNVSCRFFSSHTFPPLPISIACIYQAIQQHLMMNPDGTLMPLSWRQRLFNRDRQEFLGT